MTQREVDLVVIGTGPGGEALATGAAKAGLEVVAVDKHLVGGECPYYGCIPTKMMVRGADVVAEVRRAAEVAGEATIAPSWGVVHRRIDEQATTHWDDTIAVDRLRDAGATVHHGVGRLAGPKQVTVETADGETLTYTARRGVVVNPGTRPAVPPVDGLADTPYWTNRDAVQLAELPGSLVVIGGGPIGCELAQVFARYGVRVTVVQHGPRLVPANEPEAAELLAEVFAHEGIRVLTDVELQRASYAEGAFTLGLDTGEELVADKVLVAAGRTPNLDDLGLESVGLDPHARTLPTDDDLRVQDGLWAIGDVTGKGAFTHVSMYQSAVALRDVLGEDGAPARYHAVPHATFTDPEIGGVGMSEQQARDAGLSVRTGLTRLEQSSRGFTHGPGGHGLIKVVEDADRGVLVGATAMGPAGGEILGFLAVAVHAEVPVDTLRTMIYAYPTFHRAIESALADLS
ncbi:pyridine nucleotide-disulfide oxidoreductase [Nocardioides sp. Root1257]|uniref:dihydrolipoyl dehydrogenase family protein n=1 Tax=unclassified Nocardioides TaxID=2615069 RepID=UPI0006F91A5D|nr:MULTISPECIES: NAD(P)/FAD-dependent oxidoreductase [unclassified Nocardioides]KQW43066.1 pyridine nucleotide-disulfide oxidoreductase [Nocardioides sp. Root1257]KRC41934.1 pyridine nucleotide-disulfide oxidoreductase [Nocardioides sp. Root224]